MHVPCHAEPPQIVIGTLEHLARLDYPDFEVLVIDTNTTDPERGRPVAATANGSASGSGSSTSRESPAPRPAR